MNGKKISIHVTGMALAMLIVWGVGAFTKVVIPPEVAVAMGTLAAVAVSLIFPDERTVE